MGCAGVGGGLQQEDAVQAEDEWSGMREIVEARMRVGIEEG